MARKPTVDVNKVMQMLLEGESTQAVADHFGVSRQAIDLHRRKFIQNGQLVEKRAPRRTVTSSGVAPGVRIEETVLRPEPAGKAGKETLTVSTFESAGNEKRTTGAVSLDRRIDLIIEAFDRLKQFPKLDLEAELEKYRREYKKAAEKIDILEKAVSKRNE